MNDDELRRRERSQQREFPETLALIERIRAALVERSFATPPGARDEREMLFSKVQALDAMRAEMIQILNAGSDAVDAYVERIRKGT